MSDKPKTKGHKCWKGTVKWNRNPSHDPDGDGTVRWKGICSCGRRVYELYHQDDPLYDTKTSEQIAP